MEQPRIVTWRAVSTEEQADKESLDHQERQNREHVARWGGVIVADLVVPGMSRNYILWDDVCRELDAFAQLDDLLRRKAFDILMCMDMTRLGRTAALVATLAALCERANVRIYETSAPPASLDGVASFDTRLLMLFKAGQSEQEVRKFVERSQFGRQAQVRKGKHISNVPTGFKRVYDEAGISRTVVDEEWRPIIELFFDLYVNHGRTMPQIAIEFNARGYLTAEGAPWTRDTIRTFMRNRWTYAGYTTWGMRSKSAPGKGFRTKAEWEPIISEGMVYAIEGVAKSRFGKPKAAAHPGRFSLVIKCDICKSTLSISRYQSRPGVVRMGYICQRRCLHTFIRETVVIAAVEQAIMYLGDTVRLDQLVGETPIEYAGYADMLSEAIKARTAIERERKRLTQAYMRETIEIDEYEPMMAELKERYESVCASVVEWEDRVKETPTAERRRQHLEEIRDSGLTMLHHPDIMTANAWLRRFFVIYVKDNQVTSIHLY